MSDVEVLKGIKKKLTRVGLSDNEITVLGKMIQKSTPIYVNYADNGKVLCPVCKKVLSDLDCYCGGCGQKVEQ